MEILKLNLGNMDEAYPDDIIKFDGRYAEVHKDNLGRDTLYCAGLRLSYIVSNYPEVILYKRGDR